MALHGNWPNTPMDDAVTLTWYSSVFERISFELGLSVVTRIVETEERFPTIARFNEIRRSVERRASEGSQPKQIVEGIATGGSRRRWAAVARLIAAETPGCGDVTLPVRIPTEERKHTGSVGTCPFCQERFALSDEELAERLAAVGLS